MLKKLWKKFEVISLILLLCTLRIDNIQGQDNLYAQGEVHKGFILAHSSRLNHLVQSHPSSFTISLYKKNTGTQPWHSQNNYPDFGASFVYINYHNETLGRSYSLIPNYKFHFRHPEKKYNAHFKVGIGPAYHDSPYDKVDNNKNIALGSHFSYGVLFGLENSFKITDQLAAVGSINMTHFSNGSIKKPNAGINVISTSLGITYALHNQRIDYQLDTTRSSYHQGWYLTSVLSGGVSETLKVGSGVYPFFNLALIGTKDISQKRSFGFGFEYFHTLSLREEIKYDWGLEGETRDFRRIGFLGHYEQRLNKLSFIAQTGYYIYAPYLILGKVYFRVGIRHQIGKKLFAGLSVKSHHFKAEAAEWSLGYRFY